MMANPRHGQSVRIVYAKSYAHLMPLHGACGHVVIVGKGRPRNHGIEIGGKVYAVPCGNMVPEARP